MYSAISKTEGGTWGVLTDALQNGNYSDCVRIIERWPQCFDDLLMAGDDGDRTRDLCRDSTEASSNLLKLSVTDGFFWRSEIPSVTLIGPLSDPRPLPCKPLPTATFGCLERREFHAISNGSGNRLRCAPNFRRARLKRGINGGFGEFRPVRDAP